MVHHKIFSYRSSRTHRIVENAFGLLQARMRVFSTIMHQNANEVDYEDAQYNLVPEAWREEQISIQGFLDR